MKLSPEEQQKQIAYRDARTTGAYNDIWQSVGKCVFCDLKEKYIFFEENGVVMTISLFAYIDGQFMIIPRRHVRSTRELTQLEWETVRKFIYIAKKIIRDVHGIKGMQIVQRDGGVVAQSTVEHLHIQCTPFDAPDLSVWNYRKLKNTPLENAEKYKDIGKKIIKQSAKFNEKYANTSAVPIICDALIVNDKKQILFQERKDEYKLLPDYLTPPGGRVDNFEVSLEEELVREIKEETNLDVNATKLQLIHSHTEALSYVKHSAHLNIDYTDTSHVLRNTYLLKNVSAKIKLQPGDDTKELLWLSFDEALQHLRVSSEIRKNIQQIESLI